MQEHEAMAENKCEYFETRISGISCNTEAPEGHKGTQRGAFVASCNFAAQARTPNNGGGCAAIQVFLRPLISVRIIK